MMFDPPIDDPVVSAGMKMEDELREARAEVTTLRVACLNALAHVSELRNAWERGAITECDGKGGTRSNRNVEVEYQLYRALESIKERS